MTTMTSYQRQKRSFDGNSTLGSVIETAAEAAAEAPEAAHVEAAEAEGVEEEAERRKREAE